MPLETLITRLGAHLGLVPRVPFAKSKYPKVINPVVVAPDLLGTTRLEAPDEWRHPVDGGTLGGMVHGVCQP